MRINREEVFGPVASVIKVKDYEEALAVANDTEFGCRLPCTVRRPEGFKFWPAGAGQLRERILHGRQNCLHQSA
ncbi:hypothetical protein BZM26_00870 [Paraburkholderia strydomiana]|nr:hypothetical protein BZM26_00870 [Paraburkholderia strydomiana]